MVGQESGNQFGAGAEIAASYEAMSMSWTSRWEVAGEDVPLPRAQLTAGEPHEEHIVRDVKRVTYRS